MRWGNMMSEETPTKSAIDWKKIRDAHVPEVPEDDPALALVRAQLTWLDTHSPPRGNDPLTGKSYADLHQEHRQCLLEEIERYRWQKAGFRLTREILDAIKHS